MRLASVRGITHSRVPLIAMLALAMGMAACTGDDGKNGAQGPVGPEGPPGEQGPPGPGVDPIASTKPESCSVCHSTAGSEHEGVYKDYIDSANKNIKLQLVGVTNTGGAAGDYSLRLSFTITDGVGNGIVDPNIAASSDVFGPGQRAFYVVAYNSATQKFGDLVQFSATKVSTNCPSVTYNKNNSWRVCSSGAVSDGGGAYHIDVTGAPYDPNNAVGYAGQLGPYTGAFLYGYYAPASNLLIRNGNYRLYSDFGSGSIAYGDAGSSGLTAYQSTANVEACESCHGKPYQKHGYREAKVANLPDFAACKSCHFDNRTGSDPIFQVMVDQPLEWANGANGYTNNDETNGTVLPQYAYVATVMNDTHMSHAMEFPYPQSMANCNTCHEGKLDKVINDSKFVSATCKSCHAVEGTDAWYASTSSPQKYAQTKRAPPLMDLWTKANVASFHDINMDCQQCHTAAANVAPTFADYHSGYNKVIYDAANGNARYSDEYNATIESATYDATAKTLDIVLSANNADIKPEVTVSFYGYGTKDFYISGHTADGHAGTDATTGCWSARQSKWVGCTIEYVVGSNLNDTTDVETTKDNNLLFTDVARTDGKYEVVVDLGKYIQPAKTSSPTTTSPTIADIPTLITDGTIRKAEVVVLPSLTIGGEVVALNAPSKTVDLASSTFDDTYFKGTNAIASVAKCNDCHDALGTTFHDGSYGGNIVVCRTCHQVTDGGSHLEMQSRSIDSYAHAIHRFQYFDTNNVDFTDPVYRARYAQHIEHNFPNFTILSCEGCHNSGKYNVPDQSKSMPGLLSPSVTSKLTHGWYTVDADGVTQPADSRNIGNVPAYVTGAGSRACAGCHRAEMINEDAAGDLASLNSHVETNGVLLDNTAPNSYLYGVLDKIMGYFK